MLEASEAMGSEAEADLADIYFATTKMGKGENTYYMLEAEELKDSYTLNGDV